MLGAGNSRSSSSQHPVPSTQNLVPPPPQTDGDRNESDRVFSPHADVPAFEEDVHSGPGFNLETAADVEGELRLAVLLTPATLSLPLKNPTPPSR